MATIYNQRKVRHFAMEKVDMERLERAAKKLQVHPSWLINQAVNLAIDNPEALFDNMKRKYRNGL
jgi:replicative DNA helicase